MLRYQSQTERTFFESFFFFVLFLSLPFILSSFVTDKFKRPIHTLQNVTLLSRVSFLFIKFALVTDTKAEGTEACHEDLFAK